LAFALRIKWGVGGADTPLLKAKDKGGIVYEARPRTQGPVGPPPSRAGAGSTTQDCLYRRRSQHACKKPQRPFSSSGKRDYHPSFREEEEVPFREEEEVLLPVLARYRENVLAREPVVEMLLQHARIRGLIMGLSDEVKGGSVRPETLGSIGELLEAHIRLEEREVFPTIEEALPEEALREVAVRLEAIKAQPHAEPWVPAKGLSYEPLPGPGDSEGGGYDWPSKRSSR